MCDKITNSNPLARLLSLKKKFLLIEFPEGIKFQACLSFCFAVFFSVFLSGSAYAQSIQNVSPLTLVDFERLYIGAENTPANSDVLPIGQSNIAWEAIQLKDMWHSKKRREHQQAWYRTSFTVGGLSDETWAIYVARVSAVAEFWVNGVKIGSSAELTDPLPNAWNYPTLVKFSSDILKPGVNTLYVRLTIDPTRMGTLYEMQVGPESTLQPIYNLSYFLKVTASQALTAVMLIIAAMLAFLCFTSKQPKSYFWFMCGSLAWAGYSIHLHWVSIPFSMRWWHFIYVTCQISSVTFYIFAVHRMLGVQRRWLERILTTVILIVSISTLVVPELYIALSTAFSVFFNFAIAFYVGLIMFVRGWPRHYENKYLLMIAGAIIVAMVCYDLYMLYFKITANFAKYPYIPAVAIICGSGLFLKRFIRTDLENISLKEEHENSNQEVARSAVSEERERLMREIHDGVGGQLASTLSMMEKQSSKDQQVVEALRTSLADLRLIINSLETMGQEGSVVTLLATMRERIEPQLAGQDIRLEWGIQSVPDIKHFGSEHSLHLMRIIQEAVTNVIKHASASFIRIACCEFENGGDAGVRIEIRNDSVHSSSSTKSDSDRSTVDKDTGLNGHGLINMKYRAEEIGGTFCFSQTATEAKVSVWIPLTLEAIA